MAPLPLLLFVAAAFAASLANAAAYEWAWDRRRRSPWQPNPEGVPPRTWVDRLPIVGWLRLRRDAGVLGRGFWVRPMLVEVAFGAALVALWWWEVERLGLMTAQPGGAATIGDGGVAASLWWRAVAAFATHAVLAWLMLVASLIDLDEKTIPDAVTVPGTLIALVLSAALPMAKPPNLEGRLGAERVAVAAETASGVFLADPQTGAPLWVEPTHVAAPGAWPAALAGGPNGRGALALGLACYGLWCFALTPRVWRTSRGSLYGLAVLLQRVARELRRRPLREMLVAGGLLIAMVWFSGGAAWEGLLTGLVGMVASGGVVWAVRIVGSAALGKEAMGFGDVTLMMMVGAFLGWQAGLLTFFLAPFAGLIVGATQLLFRRGDVIPYGPFLCLAASGVVVGWATLWPRVERLFALGVVVPVVLIVCLVLLGVLLALWAQTKRLLGLTEDWEDEPDDGSVAG
ncbi:MAG: A24 family peptidase [Planctomycetota bacterium]